MRSTTSFECDAILVDVDPRVATWTSPRSDIDAAYEDVDRCRRLSPVEAVAEAAALSRCALAFLGRFSAEERQRLLFDQEPLEAPYEAAWRELVRRAHAG